MTCNWTVTGSNPGSSSLSVEVSLSETPQPKGQGILLLLRNTTRRLEPFKFSVGMSDTQRNSPPDY